MGTEAGAGGRVEEAPETGEEECRREAGGAWWLFLSWRVWGVLGLACAGAGTSSLYCLLGEEGREAGWALVGWVMAAVYGTAWLFLLAPVSRCCLAGGDNCVRRRDASLCSLPAMGLAYLGLLVEGTAWLTFGLLAALLWDAAEPRTPRLLAIAAGLHLLAFPLLAADVLGYAHRLGCRWPRADPLGEAQLRRPLRAALRRQRADEGRTGTGTRDGTGTKDGTVSPSSPTPLPLPPLPRSPRPPSSDARTQSSSRPVSPDPPALRSAASTPPPHPPAKAQTPRGHPPLAQALRRLPRSPAPRPSPKTSPPRAPGGSKDSSHNTSTNTSLPDPSQPSRHHSNTISQPSSSL